MSIESIEAASHVAAGEHGDGQVHSHVSSVGFYIGIFAGLVVLTLLTVRVSYFDFGAFNTVVALLIATMKASLVAAFFMHLRHDSLFNTLAFLGSFLFLAIFILLTYDDIGRRGEVDPNYGGRIDRRTGTMAPGGMPATSMTSNEVGSEPPKEGMSAKGPAPSESAAPGMAPSGMPSPSAPVPGMAASGTVAPGMGAPSSLPTPMGAPSSSGAPDAP